MIQPENKNNHFTDNQANGMHRQIKASLYPNGSPGSRDRDSHSPETETWIELVDSCIYPRIKFRERYMETPEVPYR